MAIIFHMKNCTHENDAWINWITCEEIYITICWICTWISFNYLNMYYLLSSITYSSSELFSVLSLIFKEAVVEAFLCIFSFWTLLPLSLFSSDVELMIVSSEILYSVALVDNAAVSSLGIIFADSVFIFHLENDSWYQSSSFLFWYCYLESLAHDLYWSWILCFMYHMITFM